MELAIMFIIGSIFGYLIGKTIHKAKIKTVGALVVETTDPDGPFMFLKLYKGVGDVTQMDYVNLNVEVDSLSHK